MSVVVQQKVLVVWREQPFSRFPTLGPFLQPGDPPLAMTIVRDVTGVNQMHFGLGCRPRGVKTMPVLRGPDWLSSDEAVFLWGVLGL